MRVDPTQEEITNMVKTYRKKPVEIQALQWTGENQAELYKFVPAHLRIEEEDGLYIVTLEGNHKALIGDFIIRGVKGEFYPCKPDIFELTYDEVEETEAHE